ncbi:MAG: hypothetical protein ACOY46_08110 [Bacillota bacterium]
MVEAEAGISSPYFKTIKWARNYIGNKYQISPIIYKKRGVYNVEGKGTCRE